MSALQEMNDWKQNRHLPPANKMWPTALIIAPSSVVPNWEREFETVRTDYNAMQCDADVMLVVSSQAHSQGISIVDVVLCNVQSTPCLFHSGRISHGGNI